MEITYRMQEGFQIPNLLLPQETEVHLGKYAELRRQYLIKHRRVLYINLKTSGKLAEHLAEIEESARRMVEQTGPPVIEDGLIKRGVIVRHLVLPGLWRDSVELVRRLWKEFRDGVMISLMSQYTPMPGVPAELDRRIMTLEYRRVTDVAEELGFCGYTQERGSAKKEYTPDFDLQGV